MDVVYDPAQNKYWRMFNDPQTKRTYPVKAHGKKIMILPYALNDLMDKFDLPGDIFD